MIWVESACATFFVDEEKRIVGTVAMLEDRTWAWSVWEPGADLGFRKRGRTETKDEAKKAVEKYLEEN